MINPILAQSPVDKLTEGPFFGVASTAAASDITFWVITAISAFFLVLISGIMGWFMWKYRRTSHVADTAGPTHHTPLEVTWTIIPLILVIAIFYVGMTEYLEMRTPPANTYDVHVTAQKWSWTFAHPNGANETNILLVPANRPVKCTMESLDVLHALYIPAFRTKQDVVPGRYTMLWFEANQPGLYDLYCAEYCGLGHSQMIGRVQVLPIDEFNQEIEKRARWLDPIAMEDLWWKAGPRLYNRCASCHSVNGEDMTGPTYKGLWRKLAKGEEEFKDGSTLKQLIDNGTYASPEDYVLESIWEPNARIVKGRAASMSTFKGQLNDKARWAIVGFLKAISNYPEIFNDDGTIKDSAFHTNEAGERVIKPEYVLPMPPAPAAPAEGEE